MQFSQSLKKNYEFRRVYSKGHRSVGPVFAVYCRRNGRGLNRIGITVSNKVGKAVVRNGIRRRVREIYRLREAGIKPGFDIVIVARQRAAFSDYHAMERDICAQFGKLGLFK